MAALNIGPVIKPARGHNRYCGPAALSIVARIDTAEAAALLRRVSGKTAIRGTHDGQMLRAFEKLGHTARSIAVAAGADRQPPTFAAWLRASTKARGAKVFLVSAGNHWMVVQGRRGACSQSDGVVALADMKMRRARVARVYEIQPSTLSAKAKSSEEGRIRAAHAKRVEAEAKRHKAALEALERMLEHALQGVVREQRVAESLKRERARTVSAKRRSEALAAQYGLQLDKSENRRGDFRIWVYGPDAVYDEEVAGDRRRVDPREGEHCCFGWEEVLAACEDYAEDLEAMKAPVAA